MYKYTYSCMYKYTYSCMYYSYNYMYQYSYKCNYVFSDKSTLRLVVNKKSSKTLSAF